MFVGTVEHVTTLNLYHVTLGQEPTALASNAENSPETQT